MGQYGKDSRDSAQTEKSVGEQALFRRSALMFNHGIYRVAYDCISLEPFNLSGMMHVCIFVAMITSHSPTRLYVKLIIAAFI